MKTEQNHEQYMEMVFKLALEASGKVFPNPRVGALVVKDSRIIASGFHHKWGESHAEVDALNKIPGKAEGATLYVNLEPCCHQGKTPPCAKRIIEEKITTVVCAMEDPNPLVAGKGFEMLENAGIKVIKNVLTNKAREINHEFIHSMKTKKPYVTLKMASTLDGKIATSTGNSKWITGEESRSYVHELRFHSQAIMVGVNTVIKDNPQLNIRLNNNVEYMPRFIIDPNLEIPLDSNVLTDSGRELTNIITDLKVDKEKVDRLKAKGINIHFLPTTNHIFNIDEVLKYLGKIGIVSLFIEGGSFLASSFLKAEAVDRFLLFFAPILLGDPEAVSFYKNQKCELISHGLRM